MDNFFKNKNQIEKLINQADENNETKNLTQKFEDLKKIRTTISLLQCLN